MSDERGEPTGEVAVIGMALRLPGAADPVSFWDNLIAARETISEISLEQLRAAAVPEDLIEHPSYVRRRPLLSDVAPFTAMDLKLFRFSPREAQLTCPEQRLLLECGWEAMEAAGIGAPPPEVRGGVFVSADLSRYLLHHLLPAMTSRTLATVMEQAMFGNDADHTALRLAHRLNLTGPALALGSTCSSSLAAVHLAGQSLLNYECDFALAGGASVDLPHEVGYLYREGGLSSVDGRCRPYAARASGTVFGSGAGIVVLMRLEDAVAGRHPIWATVRGSAINNDGAHKQSYTAPSVDGQAQVIAEALALAGIEPRAIGAIEGQGTATPLGDSIEVAALHQAFADANRGPNSCALGSVKSNLGHANGAAGIAAFIKGVLMVHHGRVPPSLHGERPNPRLELERGPFFINSDDRPWPLADGPRLAGVSAFGIGGTNVHVVVGEPQSTGAGAASDGAVAENHTLPWSAATLEALEGRRAQLLAHLEANPALDLGDLAWTLQAGRVHLARRDGLCCGDREEALARLRNEGERRRTRVTDPDLQRWLRGEVVTWPEIGYRRLRLPTYPFARERQWLEPPRPGATEVPARREPETPEAIITDAALSVLGFRAQEIAPDTDLIAWGIDSFLAAELIQILHQRLGVTVPIAMLYEQRTIRGLAQQLERARRADDPLPSFDFEWVESAETLAAIHRQMSALPSEQLSAIEPLLGDGRPVELEHLRQRWRAGDLVVLCARPTGDEAIAGLYLLDRRPTLYYIEPTGIGRLDGPFVSYSYLAPASRGLLNVTLLDRWFDEQVALRWQPPPRAIANTVRFRTELCHRHGKLLATALARGPHEEGPLFERIYFQNFDPSDALERLAADRRASGRLLAGMRGLDFAGTRGDDLLRLVEAPPAQAFARLAELIPNDALPRLRDAQRRVERGELTFLGYELRWLEPLFVWRPPA